MESNSKAPVKISERFFTNFPVESYISVAMVRKCGKMKGDGDVNEENQRWVCTFVLVVS